MNHSHRSHRRVHGRRAAGKADRPGGLRRLLPRTLVLVFLVGGTAAFVANDKTIRLSVDGGPRTLRTFADDVGELLRRQGVRTGAHDLVAPGRNAALHDGDEVVVRHGRVVSLTLDGRRRRVWSSARTVEEALGQLGVRAEGAYLSASRGSEIGRRGLALNVRTERTLTFLVDGRERTVRTSAATVREAVGQAGIVLHGQDTTSVDPDSFPREGQSVSVMRIRGREEVHEEPVPYGTAKERDDSLFLGTTAVGTPGRPGLRRVRYAYRTVNGAEQRPRVLSSAVVREPVTQVLRVGTKRLPDSVAGADRLNWRALGHCEAGGRPDAVDASGTYGGLYQFDVRTWHALGGRGRPQDAPAAEQTYRAKRLYLIRGATPWPVCGRRLFR